ncbi:DUF6452 family protein [Hanstruepera marina]|uniref:DUF6452 family protein n=1 Tax=Hanstruepera marina TaxID=2873265 RepID=UPI001CA74695|nr:DUF6452 family protein [Hanstruepera marina]
MKKIALFLVLLMALGCEKDDICPDDTVTTPRLTIEFFDIETIEDQNPKNVTRLRAQGVDNDNPVPDLDGTSRKQKILLPLKTTTEDPNGESFTTEYTIWRNYQVDGNGTVTGNPDVITITYTTRNEYVSRGCGFKSIFENITMSVADDGNRWIQVIQTVNDNQIIADENATNFNIYH